MQPHLYFQNHPGFSGLLKMKMIQITDQHGKLWSFQEEDIEEFYFDNVEPNNWAVITVNGVPIKFSKAELAKAIPHVFEEMDIKI